MLSLTCRLFVTNDCTKILKIFKENACQIVDSMWWPIEPIIMFPPALQKKEMKREISQSHLFLSLSNLTWQNLHSSVLLCCMSNKRGRGRSNCFFRFPLALVFQWVKSVSKPCLTIKWHFQVYVLQCWHDEGLTWQ